MTPVSSRRVRVQLAIAVGQAEYHQHRGEGSGEGEQVDQGQRQPGEHGRQRADRRAARNPQHVGIGQRIAQQHLHQGTRQRQQPAAGEGRQRTRQAQAADDFDREAVGPAADCTEDIREGDRHAARRQRREQAQHCQPDQGGKDKQGAAAGRH